MTISDFFTPPTHPHENETIEFKRELIDILEKEFVTSLNSHNDEAIMTIQDAAIQILKEVGKPLHAKEITERIMEADLWSSEGKTPFKRHRRHFPPSKYCPFICGRITNYASLVHPRKTHI